MVTYGAGSWAKPQLNCGPLSVFKSVEAAKSFMNDYFLSSRLEIWKCEYIRSHYTKLWTPFRRSPPQLVPVGTVLADKVKLIEKVYG